MIDVKVCAIDRSRVVLHIRPFKLLKTLYGYCFMLARKPPPINSKTNYNYEVMNITMHVTATVLLLVLVLFTPMHDTTIILNMPAAAGDS